jgi:hypothetical protein
MKKKIFSLILVISMFLTMMLPITVTAAETANYTWYNTTDNSFTLSDAGDLIGFANIVSGNAGSIAQDSFANKTVTLGAAIDLNGVDWTPIGGLDGTYAFSGIFDGADKKISNLTCTADSSAARYIGLFGKLNGATVKNVDLEAVTLTVTAADTKTLSYVGAIAGYAEDITVNNVTVKSLTLETNTKSFVGGIVGQINNTAGSSMSTCEIDGATIKYYPVKSTHNGYQSCGGAVGYNTGAKLEINAFSFENFTIDVKVENTSGGKYCVCVGGIVGNSDSILEVSNSTVSGNITTAEGHTQYFTLTGSFIGQSYFGSTADAASAVTFSNCTATVNIGGTVSAGGFAGKIVANMSGVRVKFDECSYRGKLTGKYVGGFAAHTEYTICTVALVACSIDAEIVKEDYTSYVDVFVSIDKANGKYSLSLYNTEIDVKISQEASELIHTTNALFFKKIGTYVCADTDQTRFDVNGNEINKDSYNVKGNFAQTKYDAANGLDIRLVSAVDEATVTAGDKLGFITFLTYKDAAGNTIVKCVSGETDTVYTSVKADGLDKSATDLGGDYIYVAEIEGYKSATSTDGATDITLNVIPYLVNGTTIAYDTMGTYTFDYNGDPVA